MRKCFIAIITIFSLFSVNANAGSIAVLDAERIVNESKAMQYIQKQIIAKQKDYQKTVDKEQEKLESMRKKLKSKQKILSEEAFEKEAKKYKDKIVELQTEVKKKDASLQRASLESLKVVNEKMKDIIDDLSEEKDIDLVIPAAKTIFFKDALDISDEVLRRLNKKITKVKVKFK